MRIGLVAKLSLTVVTLLVFGLGLVAYLNYARYAETNRALLRSRVEVIGLELQGAIQAPMTLGVALQDLPVLSDMIERARLRWTELLAVTVVSPSGQALAGGLPDYAIPPPKTSDGVWSLDLRGAFVLGFPLVNGFGRTEGHLILYQDRGPLEARLQEIAWELVELYSAIALPLALLGILGVHLALRGVVGELRRVDRRLDGTLQEPPRGVLEQGAESFRVASAAVERKLEEGESLLAQGRGRP